MKMNEIEDLKVLDNKIEKMKSMNNPARKREMLGFCDGYLSALVNIGAIAFHSNEYKYYSKKIRESYNEEREM